MTSTNIEPGAMLDEMMTILRDLIQINTTNPPGNELEAAKYIAKVFDKEGIPYTILESEPGRGNIIARLKGDGSKRPLLLMSHLDVVGVEKDKWLHDPFAAMIEDGCVWGRGSLDCKNSAALWIMAMLMVKRQRIKSKRDIIFMAAADEEAGGVLGAGWLVKNHFDLIDAEVALNEGGGFGMEFMGKTFYPYQSAEKGNIWLRMTARGTPGHASIPKPDNPTVAIVDLIKRIGKKKYPFFLTESVRQMITVMAATQKFPLNVAIRQLINPYLSDALIAFAIKDVKIACGFRAMMHNTVCPTVLKAGGKVNVIPSAAIAEVDFRILPGYDSEEYLFDLKKIIGNQFEIDILDNKPATESPTDHAMADVIHRVIKKHKPRACVTPFLVPGVTDACYLRPKGVVVYGFTPLLPQEDMDSVHGHNERITLESIEFSLNVGLEVVLDFLQ